MNVVVFGLGSMGRRRIRLIQKFDKRIEIFGVDSNAERCREVKVTYHINIVGLSELAFIKDVECAFICTPPNSHHHLIKQCLNRNCHVFTELNLIVDGYDDNVLLAKEKNLVLFLSSTFLYRDEVAFIKRNVLSCAEKLNYCYHVGQYLPDWHPWENFSDFFVGSKRTNGCREIFAIEFPWLTNVFGDIVNISALKGKNTQLQIDYNDNYLLLIVHASGHKGMMAVDVVSRRPVRNFEVYGENLYISWDGSPTGLFEYDFKNKENRNIQLYDTLDRISGYSSQIIENAYYKELCNFFNIIAGQELPPYSFEKDKQVLSWIDMVEGEG